jgi:hypothetical protein
MSNKEIEEKEVWKQIEGFPKYDVSTFGRVRKDLGNNKYLYLKSDVNHAGYHRVSYSNKKERKRTALHRLVLAKFKPIEEMEKYQGNHKDGNKDNNRLSNLEWVTGSENARHSYKNNLNKDHTSLIIKDITTGEQHKMVSIDEASRFLKIPASSVLPYVKRSIAYPLFNKYKIYVDKFKENTNVISHKVNVYDHIDDTFNTYNSVSVASIHTGISPITMNKRIKKDDTWYVGGYTLSRNKLDDVKRIDYHRASVDRKELYAKPLRKLATGLVVYDYFNNTITKYSGTPEFLELIHVTDIKSNALNYIIRTAADKIPSKPALWNGFVIKSSIYDFDLKNAYTVEEIKKSRDNHSKQYVYVLKDVLFFGDISLKKKILDDNSILSKMEWSTLSKKYDVITVG